MATTKKTEETVEPKKETIFIPRLYKGQEDWVCGINGKYFMVKRGEQVEVPAAVAEVWRNSQRQANVSNEYAADLRG